MITKHKINLNTLEEDEEEEFEPIENIAYEKFLFWLRERYLKQLEWQTNAPCFKNSQWDNNLSNKIFTRNFCDKCPYRLECLVLGVALGEENLYVWGGATPKERKKIHQDIIFKYGDSFFVFWDEECEEILESNCITFIKSKNVTISKKDEYKTNAHNNT